MPESARWLIVNGKLERAQIYLKKCAKMNHTEEFIQTLKTEVSCSTEEKNQVLIYSIFLTAWYLIFFPDIIQYCGDREERQNLFLL